MTNQWDSLATMFSNRLAKNWQRLKSTAERHKITCFRIYDSDIPEIPLVVDWYEGCVHLGYFSKKKFNDSLEEEGWLGAMLEQIKHILSVTDDDIYLKTRRRQKGNWQYSKLSRQRERFVVREGDLKFYVNLSDYLDTGLFLDHRITRELIGQGAAGKRVLNLFAYTGSFSVYAAAGGARHVHTVDMSNTYLRWAMDNFLLNDIPLHNHKFTRVDVLRYLNEPVEERYDIIVLDPPTFSNSKKMDDYFEVQRDYFQLIANCIKRLNPGGTLFFSTNFRNFKFDSSALPSVQTCHEITRKTIPFDFQHSSPHRCWRIIR